MNSRTIFQEASNSFENTPVATEAIGDKIQALESYKKRRLRADLYACECIRGT